VFDHLDRLPTILLGLLSAHFSVDRDTARQNVMQEPRDIVILPECETGSHYIQNAQKKIPKKKKLKKKNPEQQLTSG
jgi:hypothetical protein